MKTRSSAPDDTQIGHIFDRFEYERDTGTFRDLHGDVRPSINNGYLVLYAAGQQWPLHRLVWLAETDEWPDGQVRFRDRDRSNTRFGNLYRPKPVPRKSKMKRWNPATDEVLLDQARENMKRVGVNSYDEFWHVWRPLDLLIFA